MTRRRVYGWMGDRAGCGYYRVELPLRTLPTDRWDVSAATGLPTNWRDDADVIIGQRVLEDGTSGVWRDICRNPKVLAVYEVDDDLLNVDPRAIGWDFFRRNHVRENFVRNLAAADLVTTSTPHLGKVLRQHNPNVVVIPNYIPAYLLDAPKATYPPGSGMDGDKVVIGYPSSATHDVDFDVISGELRRLLERHPTAMLHFVGASYPGLPADRVAWTRWIPGVPKYLETISSFHIGIAPLRAHVFNQAKSHIKALEYAALGIPAVASKLLPYQDFVRHGETGFLVTREHEWQRALRTLVTDREARTAMGKAAREYARAWTIEGNIGRWEAALSGKEP